MNDDYTTIGAIYLRAFSTKSHSRHAPPSFSNIVQHHQTWCYWKHVLLTAGAAQAARVTDNTSYRQQVLLTTRVTDITCYWKHVSSATNSMCYWQHALMTAPATNTCHWQHVTLTSRVLDNTCHGTQTARVTWHIQNVLLTARETWH